MAHSPADASPEPADRAASEFARLVRLMATLRGPDGCPWDREQTIDSLKPFVLEEAYEVLDAIDRHDHRHLREELGDFVFEAVFLAQMESEAGHFSIADSLQEISDKLVRRHPHVFKRHENGNQLDSSDQVRTRWEEIKAQERGGSPRTKTLLSGIAPALPALLRAFQISTRAASVGFDWSRPDDVVVKIREEVEELAEALAAVSSTAPGGREHAEEEMGDLLFSIANLSRKLGIEPETALRKANDKFTRRFEAMEAAVGGRQQSLRDLSLDQLEEAWRQAKIETAS